ncbi:hypothetical protein [Bradyrhizobium sp. SZCCHNRI20481]|uniref:hypothetical protein n=1 Tax=Bradyrhizobium sp. SZCCHNRI20481 TaxID=3057286 RepID=UPI00291637FC|nr:hypothetical protein [Bradyrhizobium sp. SZCCHNRI20481]
MLRFIGAVGAAFVVAFGGVSWAVRGFPLPGASWGASTWSAPIETVSNIANGSQTVAVVAPLSATVDMSFGDARSREKFDRKAWLAEHTSQSDKNPKLDALRMDALQAATAYKLSPCDKTMKQNLVDALTAYTRAYVAKLDCKRQFWGAKICTDKSLQEAADSVGTPLDQRVKEALFEAFDEKGITKADFPADVREDVPMFAGPGLWSDESSVCRIRQAQRDRR